jgi:Spx/MgsR family transcriptional regulator
LAAVEIYLYSNCSSCKNADALLKEANADAVRRDIFKERLTAGEISTLFARLGLTPTEMLSRRSRPYAELGLADRELEDDEIVALMSQHPALIRRPLIAKDGKAVVGFNRTKISELIG